MILLVICGTIFVVARQTSLNEVRDDLARQSNAALDRQPGPGGVRGVLDTATILRALSASGSFFVLVDADGAVVDATASLDLEALRLPLPETYAQDAAGERAAYVGGSTVDGDALRLYIREVSYGRPFQANSQGYLMIGRSIEPELQNLRRLAFILLAGGALGIVLAAAGGYWLAGRALQPIQTAMDAQRTFVADASHELRTPLSLIRANAEVLKRQREGPPETASVDDIIKEADHLTYLVGQMLTLARADGSAAVIAREPVSLGNVAEDAVRQMRLIASQKDVAVSVAAAGDAVVEGDEQRLSELLIILLDNAVKYTDPGGSVSVSVTRADNQVTLLVSDTGQGIPPDAIGRVFDRFYRVDKARSREQGGTGLGLAIAKWIVEAHGGTIAVQSTLHQGTTVTAVLPAIARDVSLPAGTAETEEAPETG